MSSKFSFHPASRERLIALIENTRIHADDAFSVGKNHFQVTSSTLARGNRFNDPLTGLVLRLSEALYALCYARCFDPAVDLTLPEEVPDSELLAKLKSANPGTDGWHCDWKIERMQSGGGVVARKGDQLKFFHPGEYLNEMGPDRIPQNGDPIRILAHSASTYIQSLFYFVFGATLPNESAKPFPIRIYWNIDLNGVEKLLSSVVTTLNRWQIPFRFKVGTSSAIYQRTDSAVLYLEKEDVAFATPFIRKIADALKDGLSVGIPLFTDPLAQGVSIAETPIDGGSFGVHRCDLIARSMVRAYRDQRESLADSLSYLSKGFVENHIDPLHPYLNSHGPTYWPSSK